MSKTQKHPLSDQQIMDTLTSYEVACEICGITPVSLSDFGFLPVEYQEAMYARHQIDIIIKAANGPEFEFDYTDHDLKWEIVWRWNENASGDSRFSIVVVHCSFSDSSVGARHSFRTEELAICLGNRFASTFNKFLKQ